MDRVTELMVESLQEINWAVDREIMMRGEELLGGWWNKGNGRSQEMDSGIMEREIVGSRQWQLGRAA